MAGLQESPTRSAGIRVEESALPRLLGVLSPVVHNWSLFAKLIGVPSAQIALIEAANPHPSPSSLYNCLDQSLQWWIANYPDPTYKIILAVLDPKRGETSPLMNRELAIQVKQFLAHEQGTSEEEFTESTSVDDYTRQNIMVIQGKFGNLVLIVRKYLHKKLKKNKIKDLRLFILSLYPDISSPDLIPVTSDLNTIFEAMGCNQLWSYMNYFPLEQIVKQFGGDNPDMIGEIEKFKKHRAGFQLATKIKAFIPAAKKCKHEQLNPVNPEHFAKLSLILDERVADYSLKYLEELWQSLSFHMQLPPIELLFEIIDSGSIQIVFLIPTRLVPQVIHQAQYSAYFYEMHHRHVRSVTVGDYCIYESKYTEKGSLLNLAMKQDIPEPMQVKTNDLVGGYSCDFVERPPAVLQTECCVCLQILREPHMVSCCSHRFCKSCIDPIKAAGKCCPLCKTTAFKLMHDKELERSLKDFNVHCIHAENGCKWTGELRLLDEHLNVNPEPEMLLKGCNFIEIKCIDCGYQCQRYLLPRHKCRKRPTHRGDHFPSLRALDQLSGLGPVWYRLGLQLEVRAEDLNMIESNYPRDADMCKIKMFAEWLRGDANPTYEKLGRALAAVGERKLARSVCRARSISLSVLDATDDIKAPLSRGPSTGSKEDTLENADLLDIKCYLMALYKTHIYHLALALGLNQQRVKMMKDSDMFLDNVLAAWLRREDDVEKKGIPSWKTLVQALRHKLVGQNGVASEICKDRKIDFSA